jgi:hypothetical protein
MAEELHIDHKADKKEKYEQLLPQLVALIEHETDLTANLANISAALHQTFGWWWVGFYWVKDDELVQKVYLFPMLRNFPDTLPAAVSRFPKLLFPFSIPIKKWSEFWMWIANVTMCWTKLMCFS